jgi:hypothetical protein
MNSDLPGVSDLIENGIPHGCKLILSPARLAIGRTTEKLFSNQEPIDEVSVEYVVCTFDPTF